MHENLRISTLGSCLKMTFRRLFLPSFYRHHHYYYYSSYFHHFFHVFSFLHLFLFMNKVLMHLLAMWLVLFLYSYSGDGYKAFCKVAIPAFLCSALSFIISEIALELSFSFLCGSLLHRTVCVCVCMCEMQAKHDLRLFMNYHWTLRTKIDLNAITYVQWTLDIRTNKKSFISLFSTTISYC